jgi:hypothetical protein
MKLTAILGGLLMLGALPSAATEAMRVRVSPEMTVEPAWVTVQVSIEPDRENRALDIAIDSESFFRSSRIDLEGDAAARTTTFQYRGLPAGDYEVRAVLIGRDGRERGVARRSVMVLP